MGIQVVSMDVTEAKGTIAHQVNCQGAFGAGVAGAIARRWPHVAEAYKAHVGALPRCERPSLLGTYLAVEAEPGVVVANVFGQVFYGNPRRTDRVYTDVQALARALEHVCAECPGPVHVPYGIGCGLGGSRWQDVEAAIGHLPVIACRL